MAYIPARPIGADDPLAYFAALARPAPGAQHPAPKAPAHRVLDLMYGYYSVE